MKPLTDKELSLILQEGEGHKIEFKERVSDLDRELVGFANASGGRLFLGVSDAGVPVGLEVDNTLRSRVQDIARNCEPSVSVSLEPIQNLLVVHVAEGRDKPHRCSSGFYTRMGPNTQKLTRSQIIDFLQSEGKVRYDEVMRPDLVFEDVFDPGLLRAYLKKARISTDLDDVDILRNMSVLSSESDRPILNNAGVLFFGKFHELTPRYTGITCALFRGTEKVDVLDRKDFNTDIVTNIDEAYIFLQRHISVRYEIDGSSPRRREIPALPPEALREALINAVTHRDYFEKGANVMVEVYSDRIEIVNPGGLMKPMTPEMLGHRSVLRNPLIASLLQRIQYIEKMGTGVLRMQKLLADADCPLLRFESDAFFSAIFTMPLAETTKKTAKKTTKKTTKKTGKKTTKKTTPDITQIKAKKTKDQILDLLVDNPELTAVALAEALDVSADAIRYHIADLKTQGRLHRIGPDKGGYWEVLEDLPVHDVGSPPRTRTRARTRVSSPKK